MCDVRILYSITMVLNVNTFSILPCIKNVVHSGHCTYSFSLYLSHCSLSMSRFYSFSFQINEKMKTNSMLLATSNQLCRLFGSRCCCRSHLFNTFSNGGNCWQRHTTSCRHESLLFRHFFTQFWEIFFSRSFTLKIQHFKQVFFSLLNHIQLLFAKKISFTSVSCSKFCLVWQILCRNSEIALIIRSALIWR